MLPWRVGEPQFSKYFFLDSNGRYIITPFAVFQARRGVAQPPAHDGRTRRALHRRQQLASQRQRSSARAPTGFLRRTHRQALCSGEFEPTTGIGRIFSLGEAFLGGMLKCMYVASMAVYLKNKPQPFQFVTNGFGDFEKLVRFLPRRQAAAAATG